MKSVPIGPQPGPQTQFLSTSADIAIYGGSAGGGKTWALLLESLRHCSVPSFTAVIFRRNRTLVTQQGGLWDQSLNLFPTSLGAPRQSPHLEWVFQTQPGNSPATVRFSHLEHERTKFAYQGSQLCLIAFDELTEFSEGQFFYLLSRNRSLCGVRPYVRATCNPDADSWVARLIAWWIDQDTGYAIPERSGVVRWMERDGDTIQWFDEPQSRFSQSVTFIRSSLSDNPKLTESDPQYEGRLRVLDSVSRERLLHGNWKIRPAAGLYFQRKWCTEIGADEVPADVDVARGWDLGATEERPGTDPDWTCGTKMARSRSDGRVFILHHLYRRLNPGGVKKLVKDTAEADGYPVIVAIPQDPAQAGKSQVHDYVTHLAGFNVQTRPATGNKIVRFSPFSAQASAGNVYVVRGPWNERWYTELENFPPDTKEGHDDDADSTAEAFNALTQRGPAPVVSSWRMR